MMRKNTVRKILLFMFLKMSCGSAVLAYAGEQGGVLHVAITLSAGNVVARETIPASAISQYIEESVPSLQHVYGLRTEERGLFFEEGFLIFSARTTEGRVYHDIECKTSRWRGPDGKYVDYAMVFLQCQSDEVVFKNRHIGPFYYYEFSEDKRKLDMEEVGKDVL